jgi:hypothetical protein
MIAGIDGRIGCVEICVEICRFLIVGRATRVNLASYQAICTDFACFIAGCPAWYKYRVAGPHASGNRRS